MRMISLLLVSILLLIVLLSRFGADMRTDGSAYNREWERVSSPVVVTSTPSGARR